MKKFIILFAILPLILINSVLKSQEEIDFKKVFCYRQIEKQNNILTVTLLINTYGLEREKTLKIKEKFPNGFTCKVIEPYGSTNAITENSVLFVWSALPVSELFIVKYQLTSATPLNESINIIGNVSFLSQTGIKYVSVESKDFLNNKEIIQKIKSIPPYTPGANVSVPVSSNITVADVPKEQEKPKQEIEPPTPKPIPRTNVKEEPQKNVVKQPIEAQNKPIEQQPKTEENVEKVVLTEQNPVDEPKITKTQAKPAKQIETQATQSRTPTSQPPVTSTPAGFYYTIQIGASPKPLPKGYFDKYQLNQPVDELFIENMYKYSVGKFSTLKEANNYQAIVKQKGLQCFIVAYNNGQKISIKEALAISKQ